MTSPSMRQDNSYTRVKYVRYADDFIIGVEGSLETTETILTKVNKFVEEELHLNLNPDKTGIVKYSKNPIKFLGYSLAAPHMEGTVKPIENITLNGKCITRRKKIRIRVNMDYVKVIKRLMANGIIRKRTSHSNHKLLEYRGRFIGNLINLDHADIIKYYNAVIRGIYNYYDFVGNKIKLDYVV